MEKFLIIATIVVAVILAIGLVVTISVGNSGTKEYSNEKSFSNMLWAYMLSIPIIVVLTIIAIWIFQ